MVSRLSSTEVIISCDFEPITSFACSGNGDRCDIRELWMFMRGKYWPEGVRVVFSSKYAQVERNRDNELPGVGSTKSAGTVDGHNPGSRGYCRSPRGRQRRPIIRSITHAPDQTLTRPLLPPLFIRPQRSEPGQSQPGMIFMRFRGPQALSDTYKKQGEG
jgi:hypothetical protein